MSLQVRLKHALGERLMELPDRTAENPLIIGRASASDVQVPSVSVGPKHCAFFRHEGHWVVQDLGGTSGTFVNGQAVSDPVFLQIGDVVSVGAEASAPTIEVDPAAAAEGRQGYAGEALVGQAVGAGYGYGGPGGFGGASYPPSYVQPRGYTQPSYGYAAPATNGNGWVAQTPENPDTVWPQENPGYTPRLSRRTQNNNSTGLVVAIMIGVAVVGGVIWVVVNQSNKPTEVVVQTPVKVKADGPSKSKDLFDMGGSSTKVKPTAVATAKPKNGGTKKPNDDDEEMRVTPQPETPTTPAATPKATTPGATAHPSTPSATVGPTTPASPATVKPTSPGTTKKPEMEEGFDPVDPAMTPGKTPGKSTDPKMEMQDPAGGTATAKPATPIPGGDPWAEVEALNTSQLNPAIAVFRMDDYKRLNPGKHDAEVDQWMDKKFDQIWWERIEQLFKRRDRLTADISKTQRKMWDENNPEEKKKQMAEKTQMEKDLKKANETLREGMGYAAEAPPDTSDKSQMEKLAEQRNKDKYLLWKKLTLKYIQNNKGKLEWEAEN